MCIRDTGLMKDDPSLWIANLSIGKMDGPKYINCRTFDFSIVKSNLFSFIPIFIGFGNNQFNSRVFNMNNVEIPKNISGSINYLILGKIFPLFKWRISPQIRLNSQFSQFSISFQKKFE